MQQAKGDTYSFARWFGQSQFLHLSVPRNTIHSSSGNIEHTVSLRTIKVYLAAVRHIHVCKRLHKHFNGQPCL